MKTWWTCLLLAKVIVMDDYLRSERQAFPQDEFECASHPHTDEDVISNLFSEDMPDIQLLLEENATQLQEEFQIWRTQGYNETGTTQTRSGGVESLPNLSPTCVSCAKKCKFTSGHEIKKGQHLVYGRYMPGTKVNNILNKVAKSLFDLFGQKQPFLYEHHSIISEVLETSDKTAKVKVVEFQSLGPFTIKVTESEGPITIDIENETNLFYKDYKESPYTDDEIVERARSQVGKSIYHLIFNNYEHVAEWCVSGERECFQAINAVDSVGSTVLSWVGSYLQKIAKFFTFTDEIILGSKLAKYAAFAVPYFVLAGGFFLIELVFTTVGLIKLKQQFKKGLICQNCYSRRKIDLISKMVSSVMASIALFFLSSMSGAHITIASIAIGIAAAFILPRLLSAMYRKVKRCFNPLYKIPKMIITNIDQIIPGCIINIPPDHDVVVKSAKKISGGKPSDFVHLQIVHFKYCGFFSNTRIEKELLTFELGKNLLEVLDFDPEDVYQDDEVVQRALDKVGQQGFNALWYRSSHMSKFCKVKDYGEKYWWRLTDVKSRKKKVHKRDDVKPGDMVNFRYFGLEHKGIVVEKLPPSDSVEIEYVHVKNGVVCVDKDIFDIDARKLLLLSFYENKDNNSILTKALKKEGQAVYPFRPYKSARFVSECVSPQSNSE